MAFFVMRIHLQNPHYDPLFDFSRSMWDAAVPRRARFLQVLGDADELGDQVADKAFQVWGGRRVVIGGVVMGGGSGRLLL